MSRFEIRRILIFLLSRETLGVFLVFLAAVCIYLMSVVIQLASLKTTIDSTYFLFVRCAFSFIVFAGIFAFKRRAPRPNNLLLVLARAFFYVTGVFCFFKAIEKTTVAEANILHMTFPLYIALFSFLFLKGKKDYPGYVMTAAAFAGIWLIVAPGGFQFRLESLWGVGAGLVGAIAVMCLNLARKYDDAETILIFMFGIGSVTLFALFPEKIHWPNTVELKYLLVVTLFGGFGQYALTLGFKFVSAVEGGVVSSTRILMAAVLGPFLVSDPALDLKGWIGAILIFGTNVYLAVRKVSPDEKEEGPGKIGTMV